MAFDAVVYALLNKKKADLVNGKVPSEQLPSYISDAVEASTYSKLPRPGQSGIVYVTLDTGNTYRWTGTDYVNISESQHHVSVKLSRTTLIRMSDLVTYIDNINQQGLHVFFDFSDFINNAYVCTVLLFEQNGTKYCLIYDLINGRTYISYSGYQLTEKVEDYVNRTGDDVLRAIKLLDANFTLEQVSTLLGQVNTVGHHVFFDVSALNVGSYLCTIYIEGSNVRVMDLVTGTVAKVSYNPTTKLIDVLTQLDDIATVGYVDEKTNNLIVELADGTTSYELKDNVVYRILGECASFAPVIPSDANLNYNSVVYLYSGATPTELHLDMNDHIDGFDCDANSFIPYPYTYYRLTFTKGLTGINVLVARG